MARFSLSLSLSLLMAVLACLFSFPVAAQVSCGSGGQTDLELFLYAPDESVDITVYYLDGTEFGHWNSDTTTDDDVEDCSWAADATGQATTDDYPELPNDQPIIIEFSYFNKPFEEDVVGSFTYFACNAGSSNPIPDSLGFYCPDTNGISTQAGDIIFYLDNDFSFAAQHVGGFQFGNAGGSWIMPYTFAGNFPSNFIPFLSGQSPEAPSGSWPTYVVGTSLFRVDDGWSALWDRGGLAIEPGRELTIEGEIELGDFALAPTTTGGTWTSVITSTGSLVATGDVEMEGGTLQFAGGKQLSVEGDLDADGTTFQASSSQVGWGGLRVESGGAATLRGGSVVQDVKSFGGAAVYAFGDFTLDNSRILGSTLGAGAYGIYASGSGTFVHVKNQSEISGNEGDGVYADLSSQVLVEGSTIDDNSSDGVSAYKADVFLYDSAVEGSGSYGANAVFLGDIAFGWPAYSTPSQNNDLENNGSGTLRATSNSDLAAGTASGTNGQNNFLRSGSETPRLRPDVLRRAGAVRLLGQRLGAEPRLRGHRRGEDYTYDPFLTAPGGSCGIIESRTAGGQGRSAGTSEGTSARGDGPEAIPPLVWEALQAADAERRRWRSASS